MVDMGHGVAASPKQAVKILEKRRVSRATQRHQQKHPDKLVDSPLARFFLGKNQGLQNKKFEPDKVTAKHIATAVRKSRNQKRGVNQK